MGDFIQTTVMELLTTDKYKFTVIEDEQLSELITAIKHNLPVYGITPRSAAAAKREAIELIILAFVNEKQEAYEQNIMGRIGSALDTVHDELCDNPSIETLHIWVQKIVNYFTETFPGPKLSWEEHEVTSFATETMPNGSDIEPPPVDPPRKFDGTPSPTWEGHTLIRIEAGAHENDCLIQSFLTTVCPLFRQLLRRSKSRLLYFYIPLGDYIASMLRRVILPELIRRRRLTLPEVSEREKASRTTRNTQLYSDLTGSGLLTDVVCEELSVIFKIIILICDRASVMGDARIGPWLSYGVDTTFTNVILLYNPGRLHFEPLCDVESGEFVFKRALLEPTYPTGEEGKAALRALADRNILERRKNAAQSILEERGYTANVIRNTLALAQPVNEMPAIIARANNVSLQHAEAAAVVSAAAITELEGRGYAPTVVRNTVALMKHGNSKNAIVARAAAVAAAKAAPAPAAAKAAAAPAAAAPAAAKSTLNQLREAHLARAARAKGVVGKLHSALAAAASSASAPAAPAPTAANQLSANEAIARALQEEEYGIASRAKPQSKVVGKLRAALGKKEGGTRRHSKSKRRATLRR